MEEIDIDCQWLYKLEKHTIRLISVKIHIPVFQTEIKIASCPNQCTLSVAAILMSVCAVILAGLQGKYAFYASMPVALTFGKYNI